MSLDKHMTNDSTTLFPETDVQKTVDERIDDTIHDTKV